MTIVQAIVEHDAVEVSRLLAAASSLATERAADDRLLDEIAHYIYRGDTALHIAAAAYDRDVVRMLMGAGADIAATNRRGAQPLHYACDGIPGSETWNPRAQSAVINALIKAGADPNALDKSGVAPLHRAVRTRCAAAVEALLAAGADAHIKNGRGSTPLDLATRATGRGGSGSAEAKAQKERILRLLQNTR